MKSHGIEQAMEDCYYNSVQPFFLLLAQRDQVPSWETLKLQTVLFLELKYLSPVGKTDQCGTLYADLHQLASFKILDQPTRNEPFFLLVVFFLFGFGWFFSTSKKTKFLFEQRSKGKKVKSICQHLQRWMYTGQNMYSQEYSV